MTAVLHLGLRDCATGCVGMTIMMQQAGATAELVLFSNNNQQGQQD